MYVCECERGGDGGVEGGVGERETCIPIEARSTSGTLAVAASLHAAPALATAGVALEIAPVVDG